MALVDERVRAAVGRGDVGWLAAHLEARDCPPAELVLLVRHDDPRLRHLGWTRAADRIASARIGESDLVALARLFPKTLDGPPETALVLAQVYQRLGGHVRRQRAPQWRGAGLPVRVELAWLRAEIVTQPLILRQEPPGELLYQAVAGIAALDVADPESLLRELIDSGDPVLHAAALRLTRETLHAALLAPGQARENLGRLLGASDARSGAGVMADALGELAEPWAALDPYPPLRLRAFLSAGTAAADLAVIGSALTAAARHGHGDLLQEVASDPDMPPRVRRQALRALGELAGRDTMGALMALASTDPLLLGGPMVECLRAMHRRGHFPGDGDAAAVVALALADHTIRADEVATILFTCRSAAFDVLMVAGQMTGTGRDGWLCWSVWPDRAGMTCRSEPRSLGSWLGPLTRSHSWSRCGNCATPTLKLRSSTCCPGRQRRHSIRWRPSEVPPLWPR